MNTLSSVGVALAVNMVLFGLITALVPPGRMEKTVRFAVSALILLLTLTVGLKIVQILPNEAVSLPTASVDTTLAETAERQNAALRETLIEQSLMQQLKEEGWKMKQVTVKTDILSDDCISISEIRFIPERAEDTARIAERLASYTDCRDVRRADE